MLSKSEILQVLQDKKGLLKNYGIKEMGLFGSFSKNSPAKEREIDFVILINVQNRFYVIYGFISPAIS